VEPAGTAPLPVSSPSWVASQHELCSTAASAAAARRKNVVGNIPEFADMTGCGCGLLPLTIVSWAVWYRKDAQLAPI